MSTTMNINDLSAILTACAGDPAASAGDISDVSFDDLGYDSLVLIETAAVLKRDHGVEIPDEEVTEAHTPRELLGLVNGRIGV